MPWEVCLLNAFEMLVNGSSFPSSCASVVVLYRYCDTVNGEKFVVGENFIGEDYKIQMKRKF